MPHYCDIAPGHPVHGAYHDSEYGFPSRDEAVLFERLTLEIMQAGLSWEIVLKKRAAMARAFAAYDVDRLSGFGARDIERLLGDPGIIRNRRKIEAVLENARIVRDMRETHGGFAAWLEAVRPEGGDVFAGYVRVFRKTFRFMGPEIVKEFLMSLGVIEGAHREGCPVLGRIRMGMRVK